MTEPQSCRLGHRHVRRVQAQQDWRRLHPHGDLVGTGVGHEHLGDDQLTRCRPVAHFMGPACSGAEIRLGVPVYG
jgi:hypothetical protein